MERMERFENDDDLARYERLESTTTHIVFIVILLGVIALLLNLYGCVSAYPVCDASRVGQLGCVDDDVAICDGSNWSPQIQCDVAGMQCVEVNKGFAFCEEK